jgi:hypothetical protein
MANEVVKIPEKFANICAEIRDGKPEALELLVAYDGLENQKRAVLAEVAYFDRDFEKALDLDMQICPCWSEWHYSNIRTEHTSAMAFAAKALGREEELIKFFEQAISETESDTDLPEHIKKANCHFYQVKIEYLKTGIVPHFTDEETYKASENPMTKDELAAEQFEKTKDITSDKAQISLFSRCYKKGSLADALCIYENIAENNLSTMWHIKALCGYNHIGNKEKALEVILRMAKQRLWYVAANTQVRPMEFFTHPSIFSFLSDKTTLEKITKSACHLD